MPLSTQGPERWQRVRDIRRLVVVDLSTSNSVEATARTAGNLGFAVQVVGDATFTFAKRDFAGTQRSGDEVHAMSLANLEGEYAAIRSVADILKEAENAGANKNAPPFFE